MKYTITYPSLASVGRCPKLSARPLPGTKGDPIVCLRMSDETWDLQQRLEQGTTWSHTPVTVGLHVPIIA